MTDQLTEDTMQIRYHADSQEGDFQGSMAVAGDPEDPDSLVIKELRLEVVTSVRDYVYAEFDEVFIMAWNAAIHAVLQGGEVLDGALEATSELEGSVTLSPGNLLHVTIVMDQESGSQLVEFDASGVAPGVYELPPTPAPTRVPLFEPCPYGLTHYGTAPLQSELTAGDGITIVDNVISASSGGGVNNAIVIRDSIELTSVGAELGTGVVALSYTSMTPSGQDDSIVGQTKFTAAGQPVAIPLKYEEKSSANASGMVVNTVLAPADLVIDEETGIPAEPYHVFDILLESFASVSAHTGYASRKTVNNQLTLPAYDVNFMTTLAGVGASALYGSVPLAQIRGEVALTLKKTVSIEGTVGGAASTQSVEAYLQYTGFAVFMKQGDTLTLQVEKAQGIVGFDPSTWPFDANTDVTVQPSVGSCQITNLIFQGYGMTPLVG